MKRFATAKKSFWMIMSLKLHVVYAAGLAAS